MDPILPVSTASAGEAAKPVAPKNVAEAAEQFEGLLLSQLLKSASGGENGWLGTGEEDSAGLQALSYAQEQFAATLAARGGLGLAKILIPQLTSASQTTTERTTGE